MKSLIGSNVGLGVLVGVGDRVGSGVVVAVGEADGWCVIEGVNVSDSNSEGLTSSILDWQPVMMTVTHKMKMAAILFCTEILPG